MGIKEAIMKSKLEYKVGEYKFIALMIGMAVCITCLTIALMSAFPIQSSANFRVITGSVGAAIGFVIMIITAWKLKPTKIGG
jgi:hypothetical protein